VRLLGSGSRIAVMAWLLALAAGLPAAEAPPTDAPAADPPRVRLRPVAVGPSGPAVVAAPPAGPPASRALAPQAAPPPERSSVPDAAAIAEGDALLSGEGRFPVIHASYDDFQGFARYAAAMGELGGRFVVVRQREIVAEVDIASAAIRDTALDRAFSPRARDYSDEPALAEPVRRARERFGADAEIMLLVPRPLDAGLFGGIARELAARGFGPGDFREVEGRYERGAGGLRFRLVSGRRMDGGQVELPAVFDLAALAAAGSR
jgi:hypothetical protein